MLYEITEKSFSPGIEYFFLQHYFIRTGFIFINNITDDNLLTFSEYEKEYKKYIITGGFGLRFKFIETDIHFVYSKKSDGNISVSDKRECFNLYLMFKFYKNKE